MLWQRREECVWVRGKQREAHPGNEEGGGGGEDVVQGYTECVSAQQQGVWVWVRQGRGPNVGGAAKRRASPTMWKLQRCHTACWEETPQPSRQHRSRRQSTSRTTQHDACYANPSGVTPPYAANSFADPSPLPPPLDSRRSRSRTPAPPSRSWSRSRAPAACQAGWPSWVGDAWREGATNMVRPLWGVRRWWRWRTCCMPS